MFSPTVALLLFGLVAIAHGKTVNVCDGKKQTISCPVGQKIVIKSAVFGRTRSSAVVCPYHTKHKNNQNCRKDVTSVVAWECNGPFSCELGRIPNKRFGDPCFGTYKYMAVEYVCEDAQQDEVFSLAICEGSSPRLMNAPAGTTMDIKAVNYGRTELDGVVCPYGRSHKNAVNCKRDVTSTFVTECGNKQSCSPGSASNARFGDPCPGTYKYLNVSVSLKGSAQPDMGEDIVSAPLGMLNFNAGPWLNIFLDNKLGKCGWLTGWKFYAYQPGTFYATIWTRDYLSGNRNRYRLITKTKITVSKKGNGVFRIPVNEQEFVYDTDVIGTQYDSQRSKGVVPYEQSNKARTPGVPRELSRIINAKIFNNKLPEWGVVTIAPIAVQRLVALTPIIDVTCCDNGGEY